MDAMFRTSNKYYRAYVNELEYVRNNIILKLFLPGLFKFLVNGKKYITLKERWVILIILHNLKFFDETDTVKGHLFITCNNWNIAPKLVKF